MPSAAAHRPLPSHSTSPPLQALAFTTLPPPPASAGVGGGDGDGERSRNGSAKLPPGVPSSPLPPLVGAPSGDGGGDGGGGSTCHGDVLLSMQAATSTATPPPPALAGAGGDDGGGERSLNGSVQLPLGAPSAPLSPLVGAASGHCGGDGGGGSLRQCGLPGFPLNPRKELEGIPQSTPIHGSDTEIRLALTSGKGHFLIEDLVPEAHLMPAKTGLERLCRGRADAIFNTQTVSEMGRKGSDAHDKRRKIVVGGRGTLGHAVAAEMATVVKLLYNAFGAVRRSRQARYHS